MAKAVVYNPQDFQFDRKQLAPFVNAVQDFLGIARIKGGIVVEVSFRTLVTNIHTWMARSRDQLQLLTNLCRGIRDRELAFKMQREAIAQALRLLERLRRVSFLVRSQPKRRRGQRNRTAEPYRRHPKYRLDWRA